MSRTFNKSSQLKYSGGSNMVLAAGCPEEEMYDNNAMKVFFFPLSLLISLLLDNFSFSYNVTRYDIQESDSIQRI